MGEELYDEHDLPSEDAGDLRTLCIRGGYSRDEVYIGICRNAESMPDEIIAIDGKELKRVLRSMVIGTPRKRRPRAMKGGR